MNNTTLPVLFIAHGAPNIVLTRDPVLSLWQKQASSISTPKAILVISAHWETSSFTVGGNLNQQTIHDFSGFEKELSQIKYKAPEACQLAESIANKLSITLDNHRGLDHGTWVPLSVMYPDENIPVVQLSVSPALGLDAHFSLGKKLSYLRKQGVLIISSGVIVHNLSLLNWQDYYAPPQTWAIDFMNVFYRLVENKNVSALCQLKHLIHVDKAIPTLEHYMPFLVALGAAENDEVNLFIDCWRFENLGMHSYRFG